MTESTMSQLRLVAPLQGWCAPIDEAPDAVFAGRMLGDGIAIDPIGNVVHAPCDGKVLSIPASKHAIVIRSPVGAEILIHIGIDTVALQGAGFVVHVAPGADVHAGQPLITFDPDLLAGRVRSLLTPLLITNADEFEIRMLALHAMLEVGAPLLELTRRAEPAQLAVPIEPLSVTLQVAVRDEHGIHARPAAKLASAAKQFSAAIRVTAHGRSANARSAVGWMSLGMRQSDVVAITAVGADAQSAATALEELLLQAAAPEPEKKPSLRAQNPVPSASDPRKLAGVIASGGFAMGHAVSLEHVEIPITEPGAGVELEALRLQQARDQVLEQLRQLANGASSVARTVISAHLEFLDDCDLLAAAQRVIAEGKSAGYAWRRAIRDSADLLLQTSDQRLAERVDDLLDLEVQVLRVLHPAAVPAASALPEQAVVLARDLKPSQFIALDAARLAGICLAAGGPTSHVAILAAAAGIPMLVALGPQLLQIADGTCLLLDAEQGELQTAPDAAQRTAAEALVRRSRQQLANERNAAHQEARTSDGTRVQVHANLGSQADAATAMSAGAEGCGLLRTEFLFLDRAAAPDEAEQRELYQSIAATLAGRPLVIRTLDAGGDKPIPYLPLPPEDNPALGLRGIRTSLRQADLLRTQLRAILQVRPARQCKILLPMVTDLQEIACLRQIIEALARDLGRTEPVSLGVMIETPAAALLSAQIAAQVDFISIGTNDLTQYTLAMDRGHAELAPRLDALHPAVLRLMAMCIANAREHACPVTICGGVASELAALPLLIGLGVRELSIVPGMVPRHKALLRTLAINACTSLANAALQLESAAAVRALLARFNAEVTAVDPPLFRAAADG